VKSENNLLIVVYLPGISLDLEIKWFPAQAPTEETTT
jgi:hypothetical protein